MRSLALDKNRKLFIDNSGNIAQVTGLAEVVQNCETAMRAQLGEMYYNADSGIPTRGTVWDTYRPLQYIAAGRVTLAAVDGVIGIKSFTVDLTDGVFTYTAEILTIYGPGAVSNV